MKTTFGVSTKTVAAIVLAALTGIAGAKNAAIRQPAVAGQFYPSNPDHLRTFLEQVVEPAPDLLPAFGLVSPHAGYVYSGEVAGAVVVTSVLSVS